LHARYQIIFIKKSIYLYLFHNKPYSTAIDEESETGLIRLTALTAAPRKQENEIKVVTKN